MAMIVRSFLLLAPVFLPSLAAPTSLHESQVSHSSVTMSDANILVVSATVNANALIAFYLSRIAPESFWTPTLPNVITTNQVGRSEGEEWVPSPDPDWRTKPLSAQYLTPHTSTDRASAINLEPRSEPGSRSSTSGTVSEQDREGRELQADESKLQEAQSTMYAQETEDGTAFDEHAFKVKTRDLTGSSDPTNFVARLKSTLEDRDHRHEGGFRGPAGGSPMEPAEPVASPAPSEN